MKSVTTSLAVLLAVSASSVLTLQCCEATSSVNGVTSTSIKPMTLHQIHNRSPNKKIVIRTLLEVDDDDQDSIGAEEDVDAVEITSVSGSRRSPQKNSSIQTLLNLNEDATAEDIFAVETTPMLKKRGGATVASSSPETLVSGLRHRLKVGSYFALWYALNVAYNIENKKLLNIIPAPLTVATIQFFIGAFYVGTLWLLRIRPTPKLTPKGVEELAKVGFYHSTGQLATMISMGAGPISFTHIVKALEPFFSAVVSALVFGEWMKPQVYATLLPVVGGVGYACLQEPQFTWLSFLSAMASNLAFALRAVVSKKAMSSYIGENLSSANLFGVVTWFAAFISVPIAFVLEGTSFIPLWKSAVESSGKTVAELVNAVLLSGMIHYLNNEVMYLALSNVHPVTLAVGNTMKRVFILVASVIAFRNPVSLQAAIGSAIGIGGVLLYSLAKEHYEKLERKSAGVTR